MRFAAVLWRLSLAALLLTLTWEIWQLRLAPAWLQAQIEVQGRLTRAAAMHEFDTAIAATRAGLFARIDDLTNRVDRQLSAANASLAEAAKLRADIAALLPPVRHTLDITAENADLLGRCASQDPETGEWMGNPDCLANRLIPALKSIERTAGAVAAVAPQFATAATQDAQNLAGITADVHQITSKIVRPKSFLGRLWQGIKIGALAAVHFL